MTTPKRSAVARGGRPLPYTIRRRARRKKAVAVTVDPAGSVLVVAPERVANQPARLDRAPEGGMDCTAPPECRDTRLAVVAAPSWTSYPSFHTCSRGRVTLNPRFGRVTTMDLKRHNTKFGILAFDNCAEVPLNAALDLGDGITVHPACPIDLPEHWQTWLGTLQTGYLVDAKFGSLCPDRFSATHRSRCRDQAARAAICSAKPLTRLRFAALASTC